MKIISHRGMWQESSEKNTYAAFTKSVAKGFGIETDVRDFIGELVISHDIPLENSLTISDVLKIFSGLEDCQLALNIKSDGLAADLFETLKHHNIENYFVFDMSIPDAMAYHKLNMNVYARYSEYEAETKLWDFCEGIWLDGFHSIVTDTQKIKKWVSRGKKICVVSPELHGRSIDTEWFWLLDLLSQNEGISEVLTLCTDIPERAKLFFDAVR